MARQATLPRCWDGAVAKTALPCLTAEAYELWSSAGGSRKIARTFWIGLDDGPCCGLERLALDIVHFHFPTAASRRRVQGAEFWVQLRKSGDRCTKRGLEFHYDKDEVAVEAWDIWTHPELSTATYLTDGGAPLVIFSTQSEEDMCSSEEDEEGFSEKTNTESPGRNATPSPAFGLVCFPRSSRHVVFNGNMLHGVPAELLDIEKVIGRKSIHQIGRAKSRNNGDDCLAHAPYNRLSFLVNIWTSHQPESVTRLPQWLAGRLARLSQTSAITKTPRSRRLLQLRLGQKPTKPWLQKMVTSLKQGRAKRGLYVLKQHRHGDTGHVPERAVVLACRAAPGPSARGLVEMRYIMPHRTSKHTVKVSRKRPASA